MAATLGMALALFLAGSWAGAQAPKPQTAELPRRLGCFACHALEEEGGNIAVPLDGVGARLTRQTLGLVIGFPRQLHPGAKMPSYAYLHPAEQEALVQLLGTLK